MESFSAKIKEELSKLNNLSNKDLVKAELEGYLSVNSSNQFVTENQYNINRFGKLLNNIGQNSYSIEIQGKKFCIKTKKKIKINEEIKTNEQIRAFVRGCFLASGSVSNPRNLYHLEIIFENEENALNIKYFLSENEINSKIITREDKYIIYIKEGDSISKFLAFIGASKAVLDFEDMRVIKSVRNNVNRLVNCETANLNKTISASVKQIEYIKLIKEKHKFDKLSEKEKELANLRLENEDLTLEELGKLLEPSISKSGVNHRMSNILKFAEELKNK